MRRALARPLKALGLLALGLLALEGLAGLAEKTPKSRPSVSTGYELVPGYRGRRESVNAAGLRGEEIGPRRPGVTRILCMGGSTTWGHKVADDETWPAYLQAELAGRLGREVEVLNGGVSGWGLQQILHRLQDGTLRQHRPDLVLVFSGWNYPWMHGNPQLAAHDRARDAGPLARSALGRKLAEWVEDRRPRRTAADARASEARQTLADALAEAFPTLVPELRDVCGAHGARLALIRFPALVQRPAPDAPDARAAYDAVVCYRDADADPAELAEAQRTIHGNGLAAAEAGARAAGVPLLDVAGRIEAELPDDPAQADATWPRWWRDFAHYEPDGNRAFARALAAILLEHPELIAPAEGD